MRWGVEANEHPPVLHTHDRFGHRRDEVEFHPAWHALMRAGVEQELHALPWRTDQPGAHVARAATYVCSGQAEAGFGCPITMTFAAVPALRTQPDVAAEWVPRLTATSYDPELKPAAEKPSALCGMAMTEKQGGSDVRANTTRALRGRRRLVGDSPATSGSAARRCATSSSSSRRPTKASPASRCRACCPTARATRASSCSASRTSSATAPTPRARSSSAAPWPRWSASPAAACRRSSRWSTTRAWTASSATAAGMRAAVAHATWHAAHRSAFGKRLADQPLMVNVLADLAIESEAATAVCAAPRARLRRGARRPARRRLQAPGHRGGQVPRVQARPRPRLRGARVPGRQRLRRGVRHAAPVPRGAAGLDLGGLGQRHGPRRPARARAQPRGARRLLRRDRRGRRRRPAPRRLRRRHARGVLRPRGDRAARAARRRAHGAVPAGLAARAPRAAARWPTPSARRAWPATRACTTARCRPASTPRRSSRGTPRRCRSVRARG